MVTLMLASNLTKMILDHNQVLCFILMEVLLA